MEPRLLIMMLLAFIGNGLSFWIKGILKKNDYKVSYFHSHFRDFFNFYTLTKKEEDIELKSKYKLIFISTIIVFVLFIAGIISIIASF